MRWIGEIDGVAIVEGEDGETVEHTLRAAIFMATMRNRPVRFDRDGLRFMAHPDGRHERVQLRQSNEPYGMYFTDNGDHEQEAAPLEIPKSFSKPVALKAGRSYGYGQRKLIL